MLSSQLPDDNEIRDVIIIGSGSCGLAVAARLSEETPSAVFTDEEHQRYHWIKKHSGRMSLVQARHSKIDGVRATKWDSERGCPCQEDRQRRTSTDSASSVPSLSSASSTSSTSSCHAARTAKSVPRNHAMDPGPGYDLKNARVLLRRMKN